MLVLLCVSCAFEAIFFSYKKNVLWVLLCGHACLALCQVLRPSLRHLPQYLPADRPSPLRYRGLLVFCRLGVGLVGFTLDTYASDEAVGCFVRVLWVVCACTCLCMCVCVFLFVCVRACFNNSNNDHFYSSSLKSLQRTWRGGGYATVNNKN